MTQLRPLTGTNAWNGKDMAQSNRWVRDLTSAQIDELDGVLRQVEEQNLDWQALTAQNFPLPGLSDLLGDIRTELEQGCGLMKLRGLPVERYSLEQLQKLYFGLAQNIGTPVYQNRRGELMRFIQDEGAHVGKAYGQIDGVEMAGGKTFLSSYARTLTNGPLRFHTDRTDAVGLLCVNQAARGGVSKLCSSVQVMNVMLERRPDLAALLYQPYYRSRHGEEADEPGVVYPLPVFDVRDGCFTSHFSLTYIEAAQTVDAVPKLSSAQFEALDLLLALAEELSFEMILEPGDLQLINSHVTYHGRTAFEDDGAVEDNRLLLRVWLSMPNNRPLPQSHAVLWRNVEVGVPRGGIGQERMTPGNESIV